MLWDLETLAPYLLLAIIIILLGWIARLEWKIRRLLGGSRAANLEELIVRLTKDVHRNASVNTAIQQHLVEMEKRLRRSVQHVKTVRFNPFRDQGGNQSFAAAFLDEEGNGTVISSLYSRDKVSVYAKPVIGFRSEFELSDEEKRAIGQ